ncbi:MAG: dienelactone hydrolase family protein [Microbacteriaceae bacterium]|nr:dienelactone hydrolase family protein [Microbacteriaceae bacterium]
MITLPVPNATLASLGESGFDFPTDFSAYVVPPTGQIKGALIVIHEVWGLVDHIKTVADRFAAQGYLVLAPDLLSAIGIEAQVGAELFTLRNHPDEKVRTEAQPRLRDAFASLGTPGFTEWAVGALTAAVDYLESQAGVDGRIAVTGFCFGGTYSFAIAAADSRVKAAIPFYGNPGTVEDYSTISAPILALYGVNDASLIDGLPEVTTKMADAGVDFTSKVYENTGHAFFNDTNPNSYDPVAAADAWERANAFLASNLPSGNL